MDVELLDIQDFLAAHHPFDHLPSEILAALIRKLEVRYLRRGQTITETNALDENLFVVRSGAVEVQTKTRQLLARIGEGEVFGYRVSLDANHDAEIAIAIEDSLLYQLKAVEIDWLCEKQTAFATFFTPVGGARLRDALAKVGDDKETQLGLMITRVAELIRRAPVSVTPDTSIQAAARCMRDARIASILITTHQQLLGIVTDRDLRTRVLAEGLSYDTPVEKIMTKQPITVGVNDFVFDVLILMARHNIHHLPVIENDRVVGVISATDLHQRHTTSAVYLAGFINKQTTVEGLKTASSKLASLFQNLAAADATAYNAGHIITTISDAITIRLLQLAESEFGPAPIPYAWIAAGSQARNEQTAHSDQDNCLLLDDSYQPALHGEYFQRLANFVCDGLNACGYVYCPGEVMAKTDEWRQPLQIWKRYFNHWIDVPEPKALMLTCVFFDMRRIYGAQDLFDNLRHHVLQKTRGERIFLAHMASNALSHQPPLGFFRNFVLIRGGEHDHTFDLKHNGIIPIVDLARIYALAAGAEAVNTQDRLRIAPSGGEVSVNGARDLQDALEFISALRIQHQAHQLSQARQADNFLSPDELSQFERNHLKDAFAIVRTMQSVLAQRYALRR